MNADISRIVAAVWPHMAWQHTLWPHVHDISVSVLAAAVATLGVVILMELRSVLKLRQVVDGNLARVFEQLDLLRFESQQLIEGQQLIEARAHRSVATPVPQRVPAQVRPQQPLQNHSSSQLQVQADDARAAALAVAPAVAPAVAVSAAVRAMGPSTAAAPATAGEARLLSSLAQARARREASGTLRA